MRLETSRVTLRHKPSGFSWPDHLAQTSNIGGHDRKSGGHGLERRDAERLVGRGQREHGRVAEQWPNVRNVAMEHHTVPDAQLAGQRLEALALRSVANEIQPRAWLDASHSGKRPQQGGVVLLTTQAGDAHNSRLIIGHGFQRRARPPVADEGHTCGRVPIAVQEIVGNGLRATHHARESAPGPLVERLVHPQAAGHEVVAVLMGEHKLRGCGAPKKRDDHRSVEEVCVDDVRAGGAQASADTQQQQRKLPMRPAGQADHRRGGVQPFGNGEAVRRHEGVQDEHIVAAMA